MSQVRLIKNDGPATAAGTIIGSQNPTETNAWAEVTGLGTIPPGGSHLEINANAGAVRVAILPPGHSVTMPLNNGHLIPSGAVYRDAIAAGSRVFTKLP